MKLSVFLLLIVVPGLPQFAQAQSKKKLYYSKHWVITTQDSAFYYRICAIDTINYRFLGEVNDYLLNDQLVMKGSYTNGQKNGEFISYYPDGQIESQGEFRGNLRAGVWKYYFPDGKIWREVTFSGDDFFVKSLYDVSGNIKIDKGNGEWLYDYEWPDLAYRIIVKGVFKDGMKEGEWKCVTSEGNLLYKETFSRHKFKKGFRYQNEVKSEYFEEYPNKFQLPYKYFTTEEFVFFHAVQRAEYPFLSFLKLPPSPDSVSRDSNEIYATVEEPASFSGGLAAFYAHVGRNIRYPQEAKRRNVQGKIFVEFVVNIDGSLSDIKVIKGIGGGCDEESMRVVSLTSSLWIPGKQSGKPVRSRFVVPINFRLQ